MRRRRVVALAASTVGVLAVGLAVLAATRPSPSAVAAGTALIGKPAPAIVGRSLVSHARVDLADDKGKYVFVDFFASWCTPCLQEAPVLDAFLLQHAAKRDVAIVGVDIDDSSAAGAQFMKRTFATWPAIEDPTGAASIAISYGVDDPPQGYLIAPDGEVLARVVGALRTPNQLDALHRYGEQGRHVSVRDLQGMLSRKTSWVVLALALVALLAYGSIHPVAQSDAQRLSYLDSVIKCPQCDNASIAQSNILEAQNLKARVAQLVAQGETNAQIEDYVVGRFGSVEIIAPPTKGIDVAIWVVPLVAIALGAGFLAYYLLGRRPRSDTIAAEDDLLVASARATQAP